MQDFSSSESNVTCAYNSFVGKTVDWHQSADNYFDVMEVATKILGSAHIGT